jgi:tRNA modification GTPase
LSFQGPLCGYTAAMSRAATDTIAAITTPPGRGAVGIVRLSGPQARSIAAALAGQVPAPRHAALRTFRDASGEQIDQGLLLLFPAPHSYTGEDVVELQGHGGPVVLNLLLHAACVAGARPARPGEFSERAFLNGRLDLAQAEAVADLIEASSRSAARAALHSLQGQFSRRVETLLQELIQVRADLEAALDFADEDVPWITPQTLHERSAGLVEIAQDLIKEAAQGRRLREGMVVAIAGQPNVGKSTLLNQLAGAEAAIVSPHAGTTRDLLREHIVVDGLPLTVVDTAGLRDSADPVEQEGVRRAWAALEKAELILFVADDRCGLTAQDAALLQRLPQDIETLILLNKCDLSGRAPGREQDPQKRVCLRLSAAAGSGLDLLAAEIKRAAGLSAGAEGLFTARARHLEALRQALASLRLARAHGAKNASPELIAEELRFAQAALDEITGRFTSEDLLGRIFSTFCIGK